MDNTRKLLFVFKLIFKKKNLIIFSTFLMVSSILIDLLSPLVMKKIIDNAIPEKNFALLSILIGALILLPVISSILRTFKSRINISIGGDVTSSIRKDLIQKIYSLSPQHLNKLNPGDMTGRVTRIAGMIGEVYVTNELLPAIASVFMLIGMLIFMYSLSVKLTIIALAIIPLVILGTYILSKKSEKKSNVFLNHLKKGDSFFNEKIRGVKLIQSFSQQEKELETINKWVSNHKKLHLQTSLYRTSFFDIFSQFQKSIALGVVFALGAIDISKNNLTLGALIAFTVYIPQLYGIVTDAQRGFIGTKNMLHSAQQIMEIMEIEDSIVDSDHSKVVPNGFNGEIEFKNVSFRYNTNSPGLDNISFRIQPGELIGIIGSSGGGKSTILELILRFYEPDEGEILIDGIDIRNYKINNLRQNLSLVSQGFMLWNNTVKYNLTYGVSNTSDREIERVIKETHLEKLIEKLPAKLDTFVGEDGGLISGGERQRLAIARALLKKTSILLLDEATSALDITTESSILKQIEKQYEGKTVISVAHRLSTLKNASKIIVIENGRIEEMGKPQELIEKKGVYYNMILNQK